MVRNIMSVYLTARKDARQCGQYGDERLYGEAPGIALGIAGGRGRE